MEFKIALFIMIIYFFLLSKMFNNFFLKKIPGAIEYETPTEKGILIGAFFMATSYLAVDFLVKSELI